MTTRPILSPSARVSDVVPVEVRRAPLAVSVGVATGGGAGSVSASTGTGLAGGLETGRGTGWGFITGGTGAGGSDTGAVVTGGVDGAVPPRNSTIRRFGFESCDVVTV